MGKGKRAALRAVDLRRLARQRRRGEEVGGVVPEKGRIGADPVADGDGALHRFDEAVVMRGDLPRADAEPLVDAEDEEGGEPLRRRREIVEGDRRQPQRQWLDGARAEGLQVAARDGAADPLQVGGDLAADIAAIEIVEPGSREMGERVGERRTLAHRAGRRRLAVDEKRLGEAGRPMQRFRLVRDPARFRDGHGTALAREAHRVGQEHGQRDLGAEASGIIKGGLPAGDGSGHRQGSVRPARRDGVVALVPVALDRGEAAGRSARLDGAHPPARFAHEPEGVAADRVHVRIGDRDRRGHGHHRLEGIAALGEDGASGLGGEVMRRGDGRRGKNRRVKHGSRCALRA